jgi:hypothetical protein
MLFEYAMSAAMQLGVAKIAQFLGSYAKVASAK